MKSFRMAYLLPFLLFLLPAYANGSLITTNQIIQNPSFEDGASDFLGVPLGWAETYNMRGPWNMTNATAHDGKYSITRTTPGEPIDYGGSPILQIPSFNDGYGFLPDSEMQAPWTLSRIESGLNIIPYSQIKQFGLWVKTTSPGVSSYIIVSLGHGWLDTGGSLGSLIYTPTSTGWEYVDLLPFIFSINVSDPYVQNIGFTTHDTGPGTFFVDDLTMNLSASAAPVPEPSTMVLLGSGLVGLWGYGRKRFRK